jgi:hypothetical protein
VVKVDPLGHDFGHPQTQALAWLARVHQEIGTIVIGVVIARGAEQGVE